MMGIANAHLAEVLIEDRRREAVDSRDRRTVGRPMTEVERHTRQRRGVSESVLLIDRWLDR